ncbi:M4 family metallopeptidase [Marinigracilibium pacificum]|uniref:T9SS type A sorting domain-containing protein n=1 Tax=Marinigracilibium pacificum TaxID=2729599 RepID=A0A848J1N2_9BACT|nr:M4 family metallopeptidase [Marinigracilibium pacificum]NMM47122.1 T9SS type A sorting domain-containing protein [Marinigracilibium pacificum]
MKRLFTLIWVLVMLSNMSIAQDISTYTQRGLFPHTKQYEVGNQPVFNGVESFVLSQFPATSDYGVEIINEETDDLGFTHYRLKQTLNGIPIEKSMMLVHVKDGKVVSVNGEWFKQLPISETKNPSIREESALSAALDKVGAKTYIWQTEEAKARAQMRVTDGDVSFEIPKAELVYMNADNELDAKSLRLAYKFNIFAVDPFEIENVYVDANIGEVIFSVSQIHKNFITGEKSDPHPANSPVVKSPFLLANASATANTGYYGQRSITADRSGSYYYTRQSGARSIEVYDMNGATVPQNGSRPSGTTMSSSSSTFNYSGNKKYYLDAYWGAEVTIDFFKEKFNRNSYNNSGGKVDIFVNGSGQGASNNAFWYGSFAYFGNSTSGTPFTSLDVVSHEITHGVTQNSANLIYQGESGALNEAFSDIFGAYAEHYAGVGQKWTMGEYISFQRSMNNPNQHRQPDTYRGTYWASTSGADNGGVHTNSGVMNYWFYLVSEGGSGSNDNGNSFSVNGIGIEKASQIAYRALTRYLTSSSGYSAARTAVINSARDLYGSGSCEEAAATNAMHAVGVGSAFSGNCGGQSCDPLTGLSASNVTSSSATVSWNAVSGVSSYVLEYKASTASNYTSVNVSSSSRNLTGLSASTTYNVRVKYTCANGTVADYASISFTTQSGQTSCNALTGLSVSNVTTSGAQVSWNAVSGVSSYNVQYKPQSSSSYTSVTANSSSVTLSGLSSETAYDVRVNYTCSNGQTAAYASTTFSTSGSTGGGCDGIEAWSSAGYYDAGDRVVYNNKVYEALYFIYYYPPTDTRYWKYVSDCGSTNPTCDAVSGLSSSNVTQNSASISWNAVSGVSSYVLEYKKASDGSYSSQNVSSSSVSLTGLAANTSYNVRVKYTCSNGQQAAYSSITFTTEGGTTTCSAVTGLSVSSVTNNSAQISWNGVSGVSTYTLEYKATSDASFQSAQINGTSEPYTGLSPNTSYTIRVKYRCSNGQDSPYSTVTFTTSGGSGSCNGVPEYESGKYYFRGDRVVYQGNVYESQADYIYWSPAYGWWTYIGPCGSSATSFAIDDRERGVKLFPNPTRERVSLQFFAEEAQSNSIVRIFDASGRMTLEQSISINKGQNIVPIELPSLQPGLYTVHFEDNVTRLIIK